MHVDSFSRCRKNSTHPDLLMVQTYAIFISVKAIDIEQIPHEEPVRREWIKYQLRLRETSLSQIGRDLGVSRSAPITALRKPYPRMERGIARALGVQPMAIWPERYTQDGISNRPRGRRPYKSINKDSRAARDPSIQARAAQ